ncbi:T9SS type A sorting domain-containing protein [Hymenobacter caeli]|uniref:T9SS type A sorting domain-containing protein n=1 Tax=Hymenobacter caeli TaxID=2735894 RepID=A0ABX2FR53_9BACT|nr:T9SS type A sorting domain-containing protein [Hymenobacter caeli]NRT19466.1 hypothetical protein [Hymenobacter caeli]
MKKTLTQWLIPTLLLCLTSWSGRAQYLFKDAPDVNSNGLGPYTQNFDALAGTKALFNSNVTLPGVYARFTLDGSPTEYESSTRGSGAQAKLGPNNGSEGPNPVSSVDADGTPHGAAWYHFGQDGGTDRALGGIASTNVAAGKGYVGIRLKNASSKVIKNLEVMYAMEQWYNSSKTQAANVTVDYQRATTGITSLVAGTWTPIAALGVAAPSTSTAIAPLNGNAATNRRVMQYTLVGLNLAAGEEIMIRFGYVFNSGTNGNGLSIDDVAITPETNIFYSSAADAAALNALASWGTNADGTGPHPLNLTTDNTTYYVQGTTTLLNRLGAGAWAVSGANSKIIVGTPTVPATLYVGPAAATQGTVDVGPGSTLQIAQASGTFALGALNPTSTVEYLSAAAPQSVSGGSYGTLRLTGLGPKNLAGPALVGTALAFDALAAAPLALNDNDLLLLKGAALTGPAVAGTLFVTNGRGSLRRTVSSDGVGVLFPVGTAAGTYTPATLSQTAAQSEDTYSVRVADNAYPGYDATGTGAGPAVATQIVKKTWLVAEEVPGSSSITLGLQWSAADASPDFLTASAHVNHYYNGAWDTYNATLGAAAGTGAGAWAVARPGITSFSPFAVSSRPTGALPVELTSFAAQRSGAAVACAWATASEKNSRSFAVERSADGRTFGALGVVAAAGTSSGPRAYRFADEHPLPGLAYYRLRQIDLDGTEAFSPVVTVAAPAVAGPPVVVPNPGTGQFAVLRADGQPLAGAGVVRNALGAVVLRLPEPGATGPAAFDLSGQPAGLYLLQLQTPTGLQTLRVVKR